MSKNLIPRIAAMLGLQLGEEFNVVSKDGSKRACRLTYGGLRVCGSNYSQRLLMDIVYGNVEIVKLPWKPKAGEQYCSFGNRYIGDASIWIIVDVIWDGSAYDIAMLGKGWVYKSKEEAKAALTKVAAEMGVEYEL